MLDVMRKPEYFECLTQNHGDRENHSLKGIQDAWIVSQIGDVRGKRILEVGGGNSRVLQRFSGNKLWNADKFGGVGNGPTKAAAIGDVTIIPAFMGEFSQDLPDVDIVFSISVIEHIPFEDYHKAFEDMARILVPGGSMYHAVDLPLGDAPLETARRRISTLLSVVEDLGLKFRKPPAVDGDCTFECDMATNSDLTMWLWSRISEAAKASVNTVQIVNLNLIADKPE